MRKRFFTTGCWVVGVLLCTTLANASIWNTRTSPVDIKNVYVAGGEATLNQILNNFPTDSPRGIHSKNSSDNDTPLIDVLNPSNQAVFTHTASADTSATMIIELAGYSGINTFGLYSYDNPGKSIQVFGGGADVGDKIFVTFKAGGTVDVNGIQVTGFGKNFGFYMGSNGHTWYTEDCQNTLDGEAPHALVYQGNGETCLELPGYDPGVFDKNQWILAWEDLPWTDSNCDKDYNDMVVMVSSVNAAVPEPATILIWSLLGAMGTGMAVVRRRRNWSSEKRQAILNIIERNRMK